MKNKLLIKRKNSRYDRQYLKITIVSLILVFIIMLTGVMEMKRSLNGKFEQYIDSITLLEEQLNEEMGMMIHFLDDPFLNYKNRGIACNYISIMYEFLNQTQESVKYASWALYYFEKVKDNSSIVQARINLSTILMNETSYDVAENILQKALDVRLSEDEESKVHLYIYLNLAEIAYQKGNYAQALEAIELAENMLLEVDAQVWCEFSLNLSKARTYFELENYKECNEIVSLVNDMVNENGSELLEYFALPYYELSSLVALYDGRLKKAEHYFEEYITYCEKFHYSLMKLNYVDKYVSLAGRLGYQEEEFIITNKRKLLNEYRVQLGETTNLNAKIILGVHNMSIRSMRIQSEQSKRRIRIYAGIIMVILIMIIGSSVLIQTYRRSQVDFLTGAYNRVKLRSVYNALLRKKQTFYVIMFDIDNFKMCNDVYGHKFGDTVLEKISRTVMECLPKTSLFFRYGGEEFVVLCELKEQKEAKMLAETIRKDVEALTWENQSKITISIGVSRSTADVEPLKSADECLYISKKTGKNKVTYSFME